MRAEFAKVLYVVAYDHVEGRRSDARGPQAGHGLTKREILDQLHRHFRPEAELTRAVVDKACILLLKQNYFELKGGKSGKRYLLHDELTVPTLILDRTDARIVLLISDLVDMEDRFPLDYAIKKCAEEVGESEDEVRRIVDARSQTINGIKGYFFPGQMGSYELNGKTVEEERSYLELVVQRGFRAPRPLRTSTGRSKQKIAAHRSAAAHRGKTRAAAVAKRKRSAKARRRGR